MASPAIDLEPSAIVRHARQLPDESGGCHPSNLRPLFYRLLADAGLPRKRFHDLRHAYASLQIEAGEELANISKALGHSNLSTTADIYAHLTPVTQRRMAETMDRILTG